MRRKTLVKLGVGFLAIALLMLWLKLYLLSYLALAACLVADVYLMKERYETISNWVHDLFDKKIDLAILTGVYILIFFAGGGPTMEGLRVFLFVIIGSLNMHIFGHKNL